MATGEVPNMDGLIGKWLMHGDDPVRVSEIVGYSTLHPVNDEHDPMVMVALLVPYSLVVGLEVKWHSLDDAALVFPCESVARQQAFLHGIDFSPDTFLGKVEEGKTA